MKVVLNPGHSPSEPGLSGPNGVTERAVVEAVGRYLSNALGRRMINTEIMQQPPGDAAAALDLLAARIADEPFDVDILMSLHCAQADDPAAYGIRCLHLPGSQESRLLAECLLRHFPRTPWCGVVEADNPLLRAAHCAAVVVEMDHLSNPEVASLMTVESWQRKVAENLVEGVFAYIGPQDIRILVNGAEIYADPAPQAVYNDVMVPIKVLGTALGAQVRWDPRRRVVSIDTRQAASEEMP
ncbi:MAG: N-acetylmuramoyl-L-alanine amidase [Armatimonadetes bacterium]|nr:N-acetylmuramoyl-L-alanine amidase [Armatimonadota bacterium]